MTATIDKRVLSTIEALYDSVTDSRKWERVLKELALLLLADAAHLGHFDHDDPLFNVSMLYCSKDKIFWNADLQRKFEMLIPEDPRLILCNQYPEKPISCRMYLTDEELHASRMWQEVLRYSKAEYSLIVTMLGSNNETLTGVGVFRIPGSQPFDQEACDLMGELVPHFRRALTLHKQLASADLNQRMAMSALDHIPIGIIIVTGKGQIRFANTSGNNLLKERDGLFSESGFLTAQHSEENNALKRHISQIVMPMNGKKDPNPSRTIPITRRQVEESLWVMVSRLPANTLPLGFGSADQPMAILFVTDPLQPQEAPPELLQRLFGLTRREADVVEQLVLGRSLQEGAEILGISVETARTHLKAVFGKTQTSSQSDLVRLVLSSPVWIRKGISPPNERRAMEGTLESWDRFQLFT